MNTEFDPARSDAIRAGLIAEAARGRSRPYRAWWGAGLILTGAIAGASVTAGAFAATASSPPSPQVDAGDGIVIDQPNTDLDTGKATVPAPEGLVPGQPIISVLGEPSSALVTTRDEVPLPARPDGATHVRVTITCLTSGEILWGVSSHSDANPRSICAKSDRGSASPTVWMDLPLDAATTTLHVDPRVGATATAAIQYVQYVSTALGVNAHGETYGDGLSTRERPDLIWANGTASDGTQISGYVRALDLQIPPDLPADIKTPADALARQAAIAQAYPNGWEVPLYASDGTTQLGTFHVGG